MLYTEGVSAQQEGQHTLFMFNALTINPAIAGSREIPTFTLMSRNQWIGFKGAPVQQNLSFHSPMLSKRLGVGVAIANRRVGIFDGQTGSFALSYSTILVKDFSIRVGLQASAKRFAVKLEDATQLSILSNENSRIDLSPRIFGNIGMGTFMMYKDNYFGVSVPGIYSNLIGYQGTSKAVEQPHFYIMGGLSFKFDKINIKPSGIMKRTKNAPWGVDVNTCFSYDDKVTLGLGFRGGKTNLEKTGESIDFLLFYQIGEKWGIGGAYDMSISELRKYNSGSVEFVLRYDVKQSQLKFSNPRVFF
jgi:type IX secretion system PorP/SprF family membrane protein